MRSHAVAMFVLPAWIFLATTVSSFTQQRPLSNSLPYTKVSTSITRPGYVNIPAVTPKTTKSRLYIVSVPKDDGSGLSYAERSRVYRRDVYTWDSWVKHRRSDRFIGNILDLFRSGVLQSLAGDIAFITFAAVFVCVYNALCVVGYTDFSGVQHDPIISSIYLPLLKMPMDLFTLTSPALGLLLVFKTNTSYRRWDEGRKNWGAQVNSCRSILREGAAWIAETDLSIEDRQKVLTRLECAVWSFCRSTTRHLLSEREDQEEFAKDVRAKLRPDLAEDLIVARHKPARSLYEITCAIQELPLNERRQVAIDVSTTVLTNAMGDSERIFTTPVPRFYTRHLGRFLEVFLLLVPLGLYQPFSGSWNHWAMIPATALIGFFLLGIEELGIQLEEPFSVLPQIGMTNNSIGKVLVEAVEFRKQDDMRLAEQLKQEGKQW